MIDTPNHCAFVEAFVLLVNPDRRRKKFRGVSDDDRTPNDRDRLERVWTLFRVGMTYRRQILLPVIRGYENELLCCVFMLSVHVSFFHCCPCLLCDV